MADTIIGPRRYAAWRASSLGQITEELEHRLLLGSAGATAETRILDIGCGDGVLTAALSTGGALTIGIDRDPEMVAAAVVGAPHAAFAVADALRLPFADDVFDLVVANTVFCLLPERRAAIVEALRVLRPGGRLVLGELGRWSWWAAKRRIASAFGSPFWRNKRFFDAWSLKADLEEVGLVVGPVHGAVFYPPIGWLARLMRRFDPVLGAI